MCSPRDDFIPLLKTGLCFSFMSSNLFKVKVKLHTSQGGPHGWSLSRFLEYEGTESIATPPPGWDASPSYVAGTHLYTWVERDNVV